MRGVRRAQDPSQERGRGVLPGAVPGHPGELAVLVGVETRGPFPPDPPEVVHFERQRSAAARSGILEEPGLERPADAEVESGLLAHLSTKSGGEGLPRLYMTSRNVPETRERHAGLGTTEQQQPTAPEDRRPDADLDPNRSAVHDRRKRPGG